MELSEKMKAVLQPKESVFTVGDLKYFADPRWKEATKFAEQALFAECQRVVERIDRDFGKIY